MRAALTLHIMFLVQRPHKLPPKVVSPAQRQEKLNHIVSWAEPERLHPLNYAADVLYIKPTVS